MRTGICNHGEHYETPCIFRLGQSGMTEKLKLLWFWRNKLCFH